MKNFLGFYISIGTINVMIFTVLHFSEFLGNFNLLKTLKLFEDIGSICLKHCITYELDIKHILILIDFLRSQRIQKIKFPAKFPYKKKSKLFYTILANE